MEDKLKGLFDCGIRHVISLMEATELDHEGRSFVDYMGVLREIGIRRGAKMSSSNFPLRDVSNPTWRQMVEILDDIDSSQLKDRPVYIH